MYERCCEIILLMLLTFIIYFAAPGPGQLYRWLVKFPTHPSYLYADSEWQVCRRYRRVKESGVTKFYVENLPHYTFEIILTPKQLRSLSVFCAREGERS